MKQVFPATTAHPTDKDWRSLVAYSYRIPSRWMHTWDTTCYGALRWGSQVGIQFRVPTTMDSPRWNAHFLYKVRFRTQRLEYIRAANAYLTFVVEDARSPWRSCMTDVTLVGRKNRRTGVFFKDCNHPRPLMHNAFIAIRWAWEHPTLVIDWYKLQKKICPVAALYYTMFTDRSLPGKVIGHRVLYHTWASSDGTPFLSHLYNPPLEIISQENFSVRYNGRSIKGNMLWTLPHKASTKVECPRLLEEFRDTPAEVRTYRTSWWADAVVKLSVTPRDFNRHLDAAVKNRLALEAAFLEEYNIDGTRRK